MSTKAQIQAAINTIEDGGANTAAEVRAVYNTILENIYGTVVIEKALAVDETVNTTPNGTTHFYQLYFLKQGRKVTVNGQMTNKTGGIVANEDWFTIDAGEYTQNDKPIFFNGVSTTTLNNIRCRLAGGTMTVLSAIGNNEIIDIDFTYFTED